MKKQKYWKKFTEKTWSKKTLKGCGFEIREISETSFILFHVIKSPQGERFIWQFTNISDAMSCGTTMFKNVYSK